MLREEFRTSRLYMENPNLKQPPIQWPFQEPKLEVPTIYKAYTRPKFQGISSQNMALYGTVPPF